MESIKELRKICQKQGEAGKESFLNRFFRYFSIYFTWFFLHFKKLTANQITVWGTVIFVLGSLCFIKGEFWLNLTGVAFLWLAYIVDLSDGEVARYRGSGSGIGGSFVEPMTHDIKCAALFISLALGEYSSFAYPISLILLGFFASMFKVMLRLAKLRYVNAILQSGRQSEDAYRKTGEKAFYSDKKLKRIVGYLGGITSGVVFWIPLAVIIDKVYLVVIFYGILSPLMYFVLLFKQYQGIKNIKH